MDIVETKKKIIKAGHKAVLELIKVAEEPILGGIDNDIVEDLAADKLKNAAATKKLAIFDAFEILNRIEEEQKILEDFEKQDETFEFKGFAEGRAKTIK